MNNELTINFDICSMELLKEYKKDIHLKYCNYGKNLKSNGEVFIRSKKITCTSNR